MGNKVILDFYTEPGTPLTKIIANVIAYGEQFGCEGTVTLTCGPCGEPVAEFVGGWAKLDALLTDYFQGSDREDSLR